MNQDYYQLLGLTNGASKDDIKSAYRKLAMKYHPDRNPGDKDAESKFKEITEAYDVLKDPEKRALYDQYGHAAFQQGGGGGRARGFDFSGFTDIFDEMFGDIMGGGGRTTQHGRRGDDLQYSLEVTLEDVFAGKKTSIRVPNLVACEPCQGSGALSQEDIISCPSCHGQGKMRAQQGFFTIERACPSCNGSGEAIKNACPKCAGHGRVRKEKVLSLSIPAGIEDGIRIRLSGEGEAGTRGAPSGDLYVFIHIKPHRLFKREHADIDCRFPVPMIIAA